VKGKDKLGYFLLILGWVYLHAISLGGGIDCLWEICNKNT
jgi:hypothetical protein